MTKVRLGKTEIITNKNGFGALPIQRIPYEEAEALIYEAYDNGMTFYDTARFYTDSEEKLGPLPIAKRRNQRQGLHSQQNHVQYYGGILVAACPVSF